MNGMTRLGDFIRRQKMRYAASVLLAVCGVCFGLLPYVAVYRLLMYLAGPWHTAAQVIMYVALALGSMLLQILFHTLSTTISHKTAFDIIEQVKLAVTEKIMRMPLGYTQKKGNGYFKDLLMDQVERLEYPLAHALPETTSGVLLPVAVVVFLFFVDWRMALSVLVPAAVTLLFYLPLYVGIMNEFAHTYYASLAAMNSRVIEYITGIKEIKIFGRAQDAYSKYEQSIDEYGNATLRLYNKMYYATAPALVLLSSIPVSVLCVGGFLYSQGTLSASVFLFSVVISIGIGAPLLKFTEFMDNFFHIKNGAKLVREVLSAPELPQAVQRVEIEGNAIELSSVSFSYGGQPVLQDVTLRFGEGKKIALVGPSGAGKSTLANLLARFWDVSSGSITLGGADYRDIPLAQLMEHMNYVTQTPFLFNMSIRDNLLVGKPDATETEMIEAARAAQCHDFIMELEQGYDSLAGDAGGSLSGGQRQRIIIARAILRNAPVLVLDEATAFADMENQHKLQMSLNALCRDKTLILIAHRLSTVVDCDQIVVVGDGKVQAVGTHEELLVSCNLYSRMWDAFMQSKRWSVGANAGGTPC